MSPATKNLLARMRRSYEGTTEYTDNTIWGMVYLPNLGEMNHSTSGQLSALKAAGYYKPISSDFGEVLVGYTR